MIEWRGVPANEQRIEIPITGDLAVDDATKKRIEHLEQALQRIIALYDDEKSTQEMSAAMYEAKCIAVWAMQK